MTAAGTAVLIRSRGPGYHGGDSIATGTYEAADPVNPAACYVRLTSSWGHLPAGKRVHVHTDVVEQAPEQGVDRCPCGCKYWTGDRCLDCGDRWQVTT